MDLGQPPIGEHRPIIRAAIAFGLAMPIFSVSLIRKYPRLELTTLLDVAAWTVCAVLVAWNALEYALGKGRYGGETPPWLRWVLAVPYFAITWVTVASLAGMVASLALVAGELGGAPRP